MEFNIKVKIDWLEEGSGDLDAIIKQEMVHQILSKVKADVGLQVKSMVQTRASNLIDGWIMDQLNAFADRQIRLTDKWGDTIEHHESLTEMFKAKFDSFFDAAVDKDGKSTKGACGYGGKLSRIDYLLDKMAKDYLKNVTDDMERKINATLDREQQEVIKQKIIEHTAAQVAKITEL